jgi:integrase
LKENPTTTQNKIAPHGAILLISKRNLCLLLVRPHMLTTCTALGAAIETGMRSGEMLALTWPNVNFEKRTAFLPGTKNGNPRTVPLSTRALNAIHALPKSINDRLFTSGYHSSHNAFRLH